MKQKKHLKFQAEGHRLFYMISLCLLVLSSLIGSVLLVPFLLFFDSLSVYIIVAVVGVVFGMIFTYLSMDLKHLSKNYQIFHSLSIPVIAVLNIYLIMNMTSAASKRLGIGIFQDPSTVAMFYLCGFLLPYLFFAMTRFSKHRKDL